MPMRPPAVTACDHGMPISQQTGAMIQPSARCNVIGAPAKSGNRPRMAFARYTSAMNTISMATMFRRSSRPAPVPLTMASMVLTAPCSMSPSVPPVRRSLGVGHHDEADQDRRRRAEHRADHDMAGGVRYRRCENGRVKHEHRAGDAGHAAGHHHEHFAAGQFGEIGPDEQRRLDLADEDVGRRGEADRAADIERALEHPGKSAHDRRHDPPVEQKRSEHAHHQHDRQRLEGEDELRSGRLGFERQRTAADIAEHERGTGPGRRRDRLDRVLDPDEGEPDLRHLEQQHRKQRR